MSTKHFLVVKCYDQKEVRQNGDAIMINNFHFNSNQIIAAQVKLVSSDREKTQTIESSDKPMLAEIQVYPVQGGLHCIYLFVDDFDHEVDWFDR